MADLVSRLLPYRGLLVEHRWTCSTRLPLPGDSRFIPGLTYVCGWGSSSWC